MSGHLVKHMLKVAVLTLAVSVLLLETLGPLIGIRGYVGPLLMEQIARFRDADTDTQRGSALPPLAGSDTPVQAAPPAAVPELPATLRPGSPEAVAMESCVTAISAVSLHPQFNRVPFVGPRHDGDNIIYVWDADAPLVAMAVDGSEVSRNVYCEVLPGGAVSRLDIDGRTLAVDPQGRREITNGWQVYRAVSGIDGSTNVTVVGKALHALSDGTTVPELILRCGEDKTVAHLNAAVPLGEPGSTVQVTTVVDGRESRAGWRVAEDGRNLFASGHAIAFIRSLMRAGTFSLRFADAQGQEQESPFDPNGVTAAVAPLQEACHWQ
ncbi:type VI secretion system-associated protein TagO [Granulosicoccaceae sp. 1_MG-2023]|nr:type VI secretion system-associated protein TagO [Granulosicoccaceae sp. 1_MG-2023]